MVRINSLNTQFAVREFEKINLSNERTKRRLSSGQNALFARDDAAGSGISEKMKAQVRGNRDAQYNTEQAITLVQTAEEGMKDVTDMLRRIKTLAVSSANDTKTDEIRATMQLEVDQILSEIDRKADTVDFNGIKLLNGDSRSLVFHVGANKDQTISTSLVADIRTSALGLTGLTISTQSDAETSLATLETALDQVQLTRTQISVSGTRLERALKLTSGLELNQARGLSNIADADMAEEIVRNVREGVLGNMSINAISDANTENGRIGRLLATTITSPNLFL